MSKICFADYEIDESALCLRQGNQEIPLEPQVFALLALLARNHNRVVSKDEIIEDVWSGRAVSDSAVTSRINAVRRAVGDDGRTQAVIKTVPMRGFRFVAHVTQDAVPVIPPITSRVSIAVLPFRNLSSDPEQKFFADGMLEDLVAMLSRVRWLLVISNATSATFAEQSDDPVKFGKSLGARYLVSGSIRRGRDVIRITAQLTDTLDSRSLWAETYDRDMSDFFRVQDEIIACVVAAVENEIGLIEQSEALRAKPENMAAWSYYQKAIARLRNDAALMGREEIADLFDKAISLDPGFALAHAGRAFWEYWLHIEGQRNADFDLAFTHAEKAIACDPREAFGHHTLGALHFISGNRDGAVAGFQRAIELNPSFAWTYHLLGMTKLRLEQYDEADDLISTAIKISPRDTLIGIFLAGKSLISFCRKDYDQTISLGRKAMMYPQPRWVHLYVLSALGHLSLWEEAKDLLTVIARLRPEFSLYYVDKTFLLLEAEPKSRLHEGLRLAGLRER